MNDQRKSVPGIAARVIGGWSARVASLIGIVTGLAGLLGTAAASLNLLPPTGWCFVFGATCSVGEQVAVAMSCFVLGMLGISLAQQARVADQLSDVSRAAVEDRIMVFETYEQVYHEVTYLIRDAFALGMQREILVMDIDFPLDPRYPLRIAPHNPEWHQAFDAELLRKARTGWTVHRFWYISDEAALDKRLKEMAQLRITGAQAGSYEAKIWIGGDAPPGVELLVAGDSCVALGLYSKNGGTDDSAAICIRSRTAVQQARRHFELIWDDPRGYPIVAGQMPSAEQVTEMRERLKSRQDLR